MSNLSTLAILAGLMRVFPFSFLSALSFTVIRILPDILYRLNLMLKLNLKEGFKIGFFSKINTKKYLWIDDVSSFVGFIFSGFIYAIYTYAAFDGVFRVFPLLFYLALTYIFLKLLNKLFSFLDGAFVKLFYLIFAPISTLFSYAVKFKVIKHKKINQNKENLEEM